METKTFTSNGHTWHFIQTGGLVQLQFKSIDDVLELKNLDPKLWVALTCPVKGLEFSEETLNLLDTDKNGRVRVPEILEAVEYIKTYFKKPEIIMEKGDSIPLDALGETAFSCGHSPIDSAKAVLSILGKEDASEITLSDLEGNDKLFSPSVINGDGVLPPDAIKDEFTANVVRDIITCTGGTDDISGVKGVNKEEFEAFFKDLRAIRAWRDSAQLKAPEIYFSPRYTDAVSSAYFKVKDKINEFFLRCSLGLYDRDITDALRKKEEELLTGGETLTEEQMRSLSLSYYTEKAELPLKEGINPAWKEDIENFEKETVRVFIGIKDKLTEEDWKKIQSSFAPYVDWYSERPQTAVNALSIDRINEILASDAEQLIASYLERESKHPPIALACVELRKMLLYRRDFLTLLKNYVSFEDFYTPEIKSIFQAGTLFIDGKSTDLVFKVNDGAKQGIMAPLSQCYILYCDCSRPSENRKIQIAAVISAGSRDNLMVGRNGLFYDRKGNDWDATITKIIENPISIKEAFFSPYKKLMRMVQERIAKSASEAENSITSKMNSFVDDPKKLSASASELKAKQPKKMFDVGTIAALGVAVSGLAGVIGSIVGIVTQRWWMPPVFILGLMLIISLPSMLLAWLKLRQRNIAPILDAEGWAVNGNVKINLPLGRLFTSLAVRPKGSKLNGYDPYAQKKFPIKRVIFVLVLLALAAGAIVLVAKNGWNFKAAWESVQGFFVNLFANPVEK